MKLIASLFAVLMLVSGASVAQTRPVDIGEDPAQAIAGRDLPASDPRVGQARTWLKKIATATGEAEAQIAASAMKLSRFFLDSLKVRALPMEALEGMAAQAVPGKALGDLSSGYFTARRDSADKSHQAAMAALAVRK
jgi:hypothetical protein